MSQVLEFERKVVVPSGMRSRLLMPLAALALLAGCGSGGQESDATTATPASPTPDKGEIDYSPAPEPDVTVDDVAADLGCSLEFTGSPENTHVEAEYDCDPFRVVDFSRMGASPEWVEDVAPRYAGRGEQVTFATPEIIVVGKPADLPTS